MQVSHLEKYLSLPATTRAQAGSPNTVKQLTALEERFKVKLGGIVLRALIGEIAPHSLGDSLAQELKLSPTRATELASELLKTCLRGVVDISLVNSIQSGRPAVAMSSVPETASALASVQLPTVNSVDQVMEYLWQGVQGKQQDAVLGGLRWLGEHGHLDELLKRSSNLEQLLREKYQRDHRLGDMDTLKLTPTSPRHVKEAVRLILESTLRLKENEAAHIAVDLVNMANRSSAQKLQPWAYFDLSSGTYHWL